MAREEDRRADSLDGEEQHASRDKPRRRDRDDELRDGKNGSRSPDRRRERTRSPNRKERTRSPDRRERIRSLDRRERTRSPDRKERLRQKRKKRKHESSDSGSDSEISLSSRSSSPDYSSSSGESSEGEERPKREKRKRREHKKRSSRRGDKDDKSSKRKKSKKRKNRDDKDRDKEEKRRKVKEAKKFLKRHKEQEELNLLEIKASGRKVEKISADDYFLKSSEFATWLKEDRGVYFSDLSSQETHEIFEAFVDKWNAGRLHPKYYDGIQQAPRTNHNWAIKKAPTSSAIDDEDERALAKKRDKYERKVYQKEDEAVLEEILPKATGRERQMELKAIRREQARTREDSPPDTMRERDIMGGGDDFQQRLARERARREKRQSEKLAVYNENRSVVEEREAATMEQFKALVGVAGGKITIAKRQ